MTKEEMTDKEHAKKYAEESISLAISMYNPKAEDIAFSACLYGLTYKNDKIKELKQQIEKMKCCQNCDHYRWSNGDDWCNDHYGQPMYDEECKEKWELRR